MVMFYAARPAAEIRTCVLLLWYCLLCLVTVATLVTELTWSSILLNENCWDALHIYLRVLVVSILRPLFTTTLPNNKHFSVYVKELCLQ